MKIISSEPAERMPAQCPYRKLSDRIKVTTGCEGNHYGFAAGPDWKRHIMARTAVAAADPAEPERPLSASRPDHLAVVPETAPPEEPRLPSLDQNVLSSTDIDRLAPATRHRMAAYIHLQLADLEDLGDPAT